MAMYTVTISSAGSPDVVSLTDGSTFATLAVSAGRGPKGDGFTGGSYEATTGVVTFTSNDGLGFSTGDLRGDLSEPGPIGDVTPNMGAFTSFSTTGNAVIGGDLTVQGTTTTVDSTTVAVADKNIELAKDATTSAEADGGGITLVGAGATITYSSANDIWGLNKGLNVSGDVTLSGTVDGRDVSADGSKLDGIEANATADQTAAEIKTAYESNADTNAFTDAEQSKLLGIEANADVTDTANVTAAGALMDSELTDEAAVKALDQGVATTDSPSFVDGTFSGDLTVDTDTLFVDASTNNVGIGTSNPNGPLHINSNSTTNAIISGVDAARLVLNGDTDNSGDAGDEASSLVFNSDGNYNPLNNNGLGSNGFRLGTLNFAGSTALTFTMMNDNTDAERMRIDSSGNVGIGTSSWRGNSLLRVAEPNNSTVGIELGTTGTNTDKFGRLGFTHYAGDSEEPVAGISFFADSTRNLVQIGGGTSLMNTATEVRFRTASDNTTTFGSERMRIDSSGNVGIGTSSPSATLDVNGSLSKNSGSFKIDHPIKPDTHHLVHSFVEGPQADNLYRGRVTLVDGRATVNLDEAGRMTEGTFVALNGNVQCFTTNEDGWTQVRGSVSGNILTIEAQDPACADEVSWLVIGERHDQHMIDTEWTDENGRVITEPEKTLEGAE